MEVKSGGKSRFLNREEISELSSKLDEYTIPTSYLKKDLLLSVET
jgi:hypothetical protein